MSWRTFHPEKRCTRIAIDQAQEFYITVVNFRWKYCQMHRLWTLSKFIIKLQFKQITIAEIKLDKCIGYKPFISKAVENDSLKLHINWLIWIRKDINCQNLGQISEMWQLVNSDVLTDWGDLRDQQLQGPEMSMP